MCKHLMYLFSLKHEIIVFYGLSLYEVTTQVVASESDSIVHMQSAPPPPPPNNKVTKITTLKDWNEMEYMCKVK